MALFPPFIPYSPLMEFALDDAQQAFRARFRDWLLLNAEPGWASRSPADDSDEAAARHHDWGRKLHAAGYAGLAIPAEYGGQGLSQVEQLIVSEELAVHGMPEGIASIGLEAVAPLLLDAGSEEQKRHYLPRLLRGDDVWCQGFSESNAGSDLAGLKTRALRDGDDWVISGQKVWTSFAHHATMCLVLARTAPEAPRHDGLTLFLVETAKPGFAVRPIEQITGRREFNEIFIDNVRVPDSCRLGDVDAGWTHAMHALEAQRLNLRMDRYGRYLWEFTQLLRICSAQNGDGSRMIDNPHFRHRLGEIRADLEVLRYHNLKAAQAMARGEPAGPEASLMKLHWSELHQRLAELALDVLGDGGLLAGETATPWRDLYLQSRSDTIYAGTSEIQRNIVAERMLELPR